MTVKQNALICRLEQANALTSTTCYEF